MSFPKSVFILGATGYVGGSLFVSLAKLHPDTTISVLVRKPEDATKLSAVSPSVRIVLGSHADLDLITAECSNAEVVFQVSDPDDLALTQAIVAGLKARKEKTGKRAILIHTTGTGTIKDDPTGELTGSYPIWDDTNKEMLKTIDINAPHRIVDLEVIKAHDENIADVYVICPATIYGVGTGPVRRTSMQIPKLVEIFAKKRRAEYVGKGNNVWSNIHVEDLVQVFHIIAHHALKVQAAGYLDGPRDGFDNFYFATADEHTWGSVITEVGRAMYKRGLLDAPDAKSVSPEEDEILALYTGHNSRAYSTKLKALGWIPKEKGIVETVDADVDFSAKTLPVKS